MILVTLDENVTRFLSISELILQLSEFHSAYCFLRNSYAAAQLFFTVSPKNLRRLDIEFSQGKLAWAPNDIGAQPTVCVCLPDNFGCKTSPSHKAIG